MNSPHSFSIIIPCHNAASTLGKCLKALLNSDYPRDLFEIIIADDLSTDDSLEIARSLGARIIETEEKSGPGGARNRGVEAAGNDYLIFIDSDVIASPQTLRQFSDAINRYPDYCVIQAIYGEADYSTVYSQFQQNWFSYFYTLRKNYPTRVLSTSCIAIKKVDFYEAGLLNPGLRTNEDTEFGYRLALRGKKILICTDIAVFHDRNFNFKSFFKRNFFVHNFMLVRLTYGMADLRGGNPEYAVPMKNLLLSGAFLPVLASFIIFPAYLSLAIFLIVALYQLWINRKFMRYVTGRLGKVRWLPIYLILQLDNFIKIAGIIYGAWEFYILRKDRMIREYASRHGFKI